MCCQFLWNFPAVLWNKLEFLISRAPLLPVLSFCHPPLKPCPLSPRLSPSFIQFNFKLYTGRQAKRVAPWLPGTKPSHYTANWFWPAAMSANAGRLPHTPHQPPSLHPRLSAAEERSEHRERNEKSSLPLRTSNSAGWEKHRRTVEFDTLFFRCAQ